MDILLKHPYLKLPPPKSTGRESFGWSFAQKTVESAKKLGISDCDLLATVTFFTTQTIVNHYQDHIPFLIDEIRVSGGGSHNRTLMKNLSGYDALIKEFSRKVLPFSLGLLSL